MWEQNETGSEGELAEDVRPPVFRGFGGLGHDPELALGMVNEGDGVASRGADRPAPTEEINLVVGVDAASEVHRQMEIQQRGIWAGTHDSAQFFLGLGASVVWGQASSGDRPVVRQTVRF